MTITADIEVQVARTVDAVWAELTALERFPEWLRASGVTAVEREPGPLGAGTRLRLQQALAGRPTVLEGVVTAFEPPHRLSFAVRHPDGITVEADAAVLENGPASVLRWSMRIGLPLRLRLFEGVATPQVRRAAATDLTALKRRLESVAG